MDQYSVRMKQEMPNRAQWLVVLLFFFALLTLLDIAQHPTSGQLIVEASTPRKEHAQLFWLDRGDGYKTENSSRLPLLPDREIYYFKIKPVYNLERLRFDPSIKDSRVAIKRMVLYWDTEIAFDLTGDKLRDALIPVQGVTFKYNPNNKVLAVLSTGNDPIIELNAADLSRNYRYVKLLKQVLTALLFSILVWGQLHYFNTATFINSSHSTYPTRKRHWVYWLTAAVAFGAFFSLVTPVQLSADKPEIHFIASAVLIGAVLFVFTFWFTTREMTVAQAGYTSKWTWFWFALPAYIVWSFYLLCFWPGSMSPDSIDQWRQILNGHLNDWHPAFHTMTIWLITRIKLSPATVAVAQIVALGSTIGWALAVLQRFGVSRMVLWIACLVVTLIPVNGLMVVTLWKDVAYGIVMLILAMYIFQIVMQDGSWLNKPINWLSLGLVLSLVSLYRHNGVVPACGVGILLLISYRSHWKGLLVALAVATAIHTGVRGPLYDAWEVRRGSPLDKIEWKARNQVRKFLSEDKVTLPTGTTQLQSEKDNQPDYQQPVLDRLYSASPVWRVLPLTDFHRRIEYVNLWGKRSDDNKITRKYISSNEFGIDEASLMPGAMTFLFQVFNESRDSKYLFWMWRPAVFLYIMTGLFFLVSWRFKEKIYLVIAPILLNSLPLFLIVIHKSVFRYHYPTVILGLLLIIPLLFLKPLDNGENGKYQQ